MKTAGSAARAFLLALGSVAALSCGTLMQSYAPEDLNKARIPDQTYYEDSVRVYFAEYPNPFTEKDFLWFVTFCEGDVEMKVFGLEGDTLIAMYRFEPQDIPLYTIARVPNTDQMVKCVLFVNGRIKCARIYSDWYPIPMSHWKTQYTVFQ